MKCFKQISRVAGAMALIFSMLVLTSSTALADTANMDASVEVYEEISITVNSQLNFGSIARPHTGTATLSITAGGIASLSGGDGANHYGDHIVGQFTISGEAEQSVSFSHTITNFDALTNLNFSSANFSQAADTPHALSTEAEGGNLVVDVGGNLDVPNTATTGVHAASITIDVQYE